MSAAGGPVHGGAAVSFPEGACRRIRTPQCDLVVVKSAGRYHAFDNSCPHQHFAALHRGRLEGITLQCPMHGWTFDVRTGRSILGDGCLRTHPVSVRDDGLWISIG